MSKDEQAGASSTTSPGRAAARPRAPPLRAGTRRRSTGTTRAEGRARCGPAPRRWRAPRLPCAREGGGAGRRSRRPCSARPGSRAPGRREGLQALPRRVHVRGLGVVVEARRPRPSATCSSTCSTPAEGGARRAAMASGGAPRRRAAVAAARRSHGEMRAGQLHVGARGRAASSRPSRAEGGPRRPRRRRRPSGGAPVRVEGHQARPARRAPARRRPGRRRSPPRSRPPSGSRRSAPWPRA